MDSWVVRFFRPTKTGIAHDLSHQVFATTMLLPQQQCTAWLRTRGQSGLEIQKLALCEPPRPGPNT